MIEIYEICADYHRRSFELLLVLSWLPRGASMSSEHSGKESARGNRVWVSSLRQRMEEVRKLMINR